MHGALPWVMRLENGVAKATYSLTELQKQVPVGFVAAAMAGDLLTFLKPSGLSWVEEMACAGSAVPSTTADKPASVPLLDT